MELLRRKKVTVYPKPEGCIRVATFNVHFGKKIDRIIHAFKTNPNLSLADVLLLQEIELHPHEKISRAEMLAQALGMHFVYVPARPLLLGGSHGLAILSRFPMSDLEVYTLPLYNLVFNTRNRIAMSVNVKVGKVKVRVSNVHLDTTINSKHRIKQLSGLIEKLNESNAERVVLGGDFNTIPLLVVGRKLPVFYSNQRMKLEKYLKGKGFISSLELTGYTMKRGLIRFRLDAVYVKNLKLVKCGVERSVKASDHKPLWSDIVIS